MARTGPNSRSSRSLSLIWRTFIRTVQFVAVTVFVIIVTITFLNIFRRFFGLSSYTWVEETARVLLTWLTFLGGTLAVAHGTHLVLDFLEGRGPQLFRRLIFSFVTLMSATFCGLLMYEGWQYSLRTSRRALPSLEISAGWMVNSAVVGGALFAVALIGSVAQQSARSAGRTDQLGVQAEASPGVDG